MASSSSTVPSAVPGGVPKPKIHVTKAAPQPTTTSQNSLTNVSTLHSSTVRDPRGGNGIKRPLAESNAQNNARPTPSAPRHAKRAAYEEPIEIYEDRTLAVIFRVTLNPNQKVDSNNHRLIYLPNLRQDLVDEGVPIMLTKERLDSAILEVCATGISVLLFNCVIFAVIALLSILFKPLNPS